jgi:hypothetical protein
MGLRIAAACCLLAGCGFTVNAGSGPGGGSDGGDAPIVDAPGGDTPVPDAPADAMTDAMTDAMIDGPSPACISSGTMDTFTGNTPCSPWATYDETRATVVQTGGKLRITPSQSVLTTHGGCFATGLSNWGPEGLFVAVDDALEGSSSYTALTAYVALGTASQIVVRNGMIEVWNPGIGVALVSTIYNPVAMKWWRLRPVTTGVTAEYSANALDWVFLATVLGTPPSQIRIDIGAGTNSQELSAGAAVFDNLNVCP